MTDLHISFSTSKR